MNKYIDDHSNVSQEFKRFRRAGLYSSYPLTGRIVWMKRNSVHVKARVSSRISTLMLRLKDNM